MQKLIIFVSVVISIGSAWEMFKQCDVRWGMTNLGSSTDTICKEGSLLTSLAMIIASYRVGCDQSPCNPGQLNSWLTSKNGFLPNKMIDFNIITNLGFAFEGCISDSTEIMSRIQSKVPVIIQSQADNTWALAVGFDGEQIRTNHPEKGSDVMNIGSVLKACSYSRVTDI